MPGIFINSSRAAMLGLSLKLSGDLTDPSAISNSASSFRYSCRSTANRSQLVLAHVPVPAFAAMSSMSRRNS